jgi:hypothetical protein
MVDVDLSPWSGVYSIPSTMRYEDTVVATRDLELDAGTGVARVLLTCGWQLQTAYILIDMTGMLAKC